MSIPFSKYSGCGNDFILIDNRYLGLKPCPQTITKLCHRHQGIGADGLIFLEATPEAPFRMRIFNADGSEAEMCGNGIRCLAHFIHSKTPQIRKFTIHSMFSSMDVVVEDAHVIVTMPSPTKRVHTHTLSINKQPFLLYILDTGVPHAVIFVEDIEQPDLFSTAPHIRFHPDFQPKGTNVNFAQILPNKSVAVRTYERGVEGETLACGTGAVAVALIAATTHALPSPITICPRSNDQLHITFEGSLPNLTKLTMKGPAVKICDGLLQF